VRKAHQKLVGARGSVLVADAGGLPFVDAAFDAALSYGEPLSHMGDPDSALAELGRVLRPGGRAVLSVDNEWNVRTVASPRLLLQAAATRGGAVRDWEFYDDDGHPVRLTLKTFTHAELVGLLERHGFRVEDVVGIHVFTLLVPLATDARAHDWRARAFRLLHRLDRRVAGRWPFNRLGYSKIVAARRD
jgi:SAM-dependent methyltransferase